MLSNPQISLSSVGPIERYIHNNLQHFNEINPINYSQHLHIYKNVLYSYGEIVIALILRSIDSLVYRQVTSTKLRIFSISIN